MSEIVFAMPAAAPPALAKPSPAPDTKGSDAKDTPPFKDVLQAAQAQRPAEAKPEPKAEAKPADSQAAEPTAEGEQAALTAMAVALAPALLKLMPILLEVETATAQNPAQLVMPGEEQAQAPQAPLLISLPEEAAPQESQSAAEAFSKILEAMPDAQQAPTAKPQTLEAMPNAQQAPTAKPQTVVAAAAGPEGSAAQSADSLEKGQSQVATTTESQVGVKLASSGPSESAGKAREAEPVTPVASHRTAAPVAAEPARLAEAQTTGVISQIRDGIESLVQSKNTSVRLQLYPESLGHIELRVTSGEGGLRISLNADTPATGVLLEKHLSDLRQALSETGLNVSGVFVALGQNPRQHQQPSDSRRSATQSGGASISPLGPAEADSETASAGRLGLGGAGGRVDYWI